MARCEEKTEVYSRVVGYFRPVQQWNKGKKEEYKQRQVYRMGSEMSQEFDVIEFPVIENEKTADKRVSGNVAN